MHLIIHYRACNQRQRKFLGIVQSKTIHLSTNLPQEQRKERVSRSAQIPADPAIPRKIADYDSTDGRPANGTCNNLRARALHNSKLLKLEGCWARGSRRVSRSGGEKTRLEHLSRESRAARVKYNVRWSARQVVARLAALCNAFAYPRGKKREEAWSGARVFDAAATRKREGKPGKAGKADKGNAETTPACLDDYATLPVSSSRFILGCVLPFLCRRSRLSSLIRYRDR